MVNAFISHANHIQNILTSIVKDNEQHALWLNTLSFLENCGARKIAACEHPTLVKEEMLKHAAEEFRHAHYLKSQITKISTKRLETYSLSSVLGGITTWQYLPLLDLHVCGYLKQHQLSNEQIKATAYLLVTYAIELRAGELYPIYDAILRQSDSRVKVKSIVLEEQEHLNEMRQGIEQLPLGWHHAQYACSIESRLCESWLYQVERTTKDKGPKGPKRPKGPKQGLKGQT